MRSYDFLPTCSRFSLFFCVQQGSEGKGKMSLRGRVQGVSSSSASERAAMLRCSPAYLARFTADPLKSR